MKQGTGNSETQNTVHVVSKDVLERWEADVQIMRDSIRLMLSNRLAEAETVLERGRVAAESRTPDFAAGDHDLRGGFVFVSSIFGLMSGLASMESNQLEQALARLRRADELLALDGEWAGKTVLRGVCILCVGLVQIMNGSFLLGGGNLLRSWMWLRYLESDGLPFAGHERECVRSTSLLALGVFNLLVSMLPPTLMRTATWITGFSTGRQTGLDQLRICWQEEGIQAPFAGLVLIGFTVDVSSFLGEFRQQREQRFLEAKRVLDWAKVNYPSSFFYDGLQSSYMASTRDLPGALTKLDGVLGVVDGLPAFVFIVHVRMGVLHMASFNWCEAGDAFHKAVEVNRKVGRRALCPGLCLTAYLCYLQAGHDVDARQMLELCSSYRLEKKKWGTLDKTALRQAETFLQRGTMPPREVAEGRDVQEDEQEEGAKQEKKESADKELQNLDKFLEEEEDEEEAADQEESEALEWRPKMLLFQKICVIHRAVDFMTTGQAQEFVRMIQAELDACHDDVDWRCIGYFILSEALRQTEQWDEALQTCSSGLALAPCISERAKKSGCVHFFHLTAAYAHHAKGAPSAAKDELTKLSTLSNDHFFQKAIDFKATHLQRLVDIEMEEQYKQIVVPARNRVRLVIAVPAGVEAVEWDWVLAEYTLSFVAEFQPQASGADSFRVQDVDQHSAEKGSWSGILEAAHPGRLELVFDNSFSFLRGKDVRYRIQPAGLQVEQVG